MKKNLQSAIILQNSWHLKLFLLVLVFLPLLIFNSSLENQFTTWDDNGYITENADLGIFKQDENPVKKIFSSYVMGNYHPLTMLTYHIEYYFFQFNPKPYIITNLLIHILNGILVFFFVLLLNQKPLTAFIAGILFAIHPMHVESVSWISERKDVLYTFFFLIGLCSYIFYTRENKIKYLLATLLLFALALLSKGMAVSFPLVLFLLDYYFGRRYNIKIIFEKLPFLLLSLIFGFIAIDAQKAGQALGDLDLYNLWDRIVFACYSVVMYLYKFFIPNNQSAIYPYPLKSSGYLPSFYYYFPVIIAAAGYLSFKMKFWNKYNIFGFGFFIFTIASVLQLVPVGIAIMADRYTYIPYIGIGIIVALAINRLIEKSIINKNIIIGCLTIYILSLSFYSNARSKVWKDSITLWTDVISKNDNYAFAYLSRGEAFCKINRFENGIKDFTIAIQINPQYAQAYNDRGIAFAALKQFNYALQDYDFAIKFKPEFSKAYFNKGNALVSLGRYEESIGFYNNSLTYDPYFEKAYYNRAVAYYTTRNFKLALEDALKAKQLGFQGDPNFVPAIQSQLNNL
jgi:protein O-mannosyl-transferase